MERNFRRTVRQPKHFVLLLILVQMMLSSCTNMTDTWVIFCLGIVAVKLHKIKDDITKLTSLIEMTGKEGHVRKKELLYEENQRSRFVVTNPTAAPYGGGCLMECLITRHPSQHD